MQLDKIRTLGKWLKTLRPKSHAIDATAAQAYAQPARGTRAPLRVLIAHDDAAVRRAYQRILLETNASLGTFQATCCTRAEEVVSLVQRAALQDRPFAVVLIDLPGSGSDGVWAAVHVRETDPAVEIALCTDCSEVDPLEISALVAPEDKIAYLPRSSPAREVREVIIALASKWLAERRVIRLAYFDALTELPNREQFRNRLSGAVEAARRQNRVLALLYLDLDGFKSVNDNFGHAAGDELLRVVASRLRNNLRCDKFARADGEAIARPGDLARLGGDEFVAMLSNLRKTHDAARVAQRLIQVIGEPVRLAARSLVVTPSVGIAIYPKDGSDAETLLHSADSAMYFAKRNGPGTFSFFDPRMSAREHAHSAPPNVQQDAVR